jgi:opacity protein-like surface antigen
MKKITLLMAVCVAALGFTGCAITKSTSIMRVEAGPQSVRPLPLTADLNISEQKVRGEAQGTIDVKLGGEDAAIRLATARALGQDPPKPEAPDVLVAMNVYKELNGKNIKVVVTGYPAWYTNFRTAKEAGDSAWLILPAVGAESSAGGGQPVILPGQITLQGPNPVKKDRLLKPAANMRFGLHTESRFNFASISGGNENPDIDAGFGWAWGLSLKSSFSDVFNVSCGVNFYVGNIGTIESSYNGNEPYYNYYSGTYSYRSYTVTYKQVLSEMGLTVPVFYQYVLPIGYPAYVGVGVQMGINFGATAEMERTITYSDGSSESDSDSDDIDDRNIFDFGWGFGIGYYVLPGLDIGLRWMFNITEPFDFDDYNGSHKMKSSLSTLSIGATYTF